MIIGHHVLGDQPALQAAASAFEIPFPVPSRVNVLPCCFRWFCSLKVEKGVCAENRSHRLQIVLA